MSVLFTHMLPFITLLHHKCCDFSFVIGEQCWLSIFYYNMCKHYEIGRTSAGFCCHVFMLVFFVTFLDYVILCANVLGICYNIFTNVHIIR